MDDSDFLNGFWNVADRRLAAPPDSGPGINRTMDLTHTGRAGA